MKKNEEVSDKVLSEKLLDLMTHHMVEESKHLVSFYENQVKLYTNLKQLEEDSEPLKIFRSAHKRWQQKVDLLDSKLNEAQENLMVELDGLSELIDSTKSAKDKKSKKKNQLSAGFIMELKVSVLHELYLD